MEKPDFRRYYVLYVDDEERSLKSFERAFGDQFRILTAINAADALKLFEQHADEIAVLMTDQRMPGEKGVWLLEKARQLRPSALRILVTAYTDMDAMIEAVNTGSIFHYVSKPWDPAVLESTLKHALQLFSVQRERNELLREKMSVLHNMMIADRVVSLGFMAAGMSHHIRNWLVAVKTFIDLVPHELRSEGVDPQQTKNPEFWNECHESAETNLQKINNLLKELWVIAETPTLAFTDPIHLRQVIEDVVLSMRPSLEAKQISVENNVPDTLPVLTVDKAKFSRMIELLLKDEVVSLSPGSRINVSAELGKPGQARISVRDNGPGLSQEILETIFDPFNARSDSPTEHGINLMACYFIVHYHGGRIHAQSDASQGTQFTIELPITSDHPAALSNDAGLWQKIHRTDQLWEKLVAAR